LSSSGSAAAKALSGEEGKVTFIGGHLGQAFTNPVEWKGKKAMAVDSADVSLSLVGSSGLFKGTASEPGTGKKFSFRGALSRKNDMGAGFFLGDGSSEQGLRRERAGYHAHPEKKRQNWSRKDSPPGPNWIAHYWSLFGPADTTVSPSGRQLTPAIYDPSMARIVSAQVDCGGPVDWKPARY
jgi:hypothetical protein